MIAKNVSSNNIDSFIRHMPGYLLIKEPNLTYKSGNLIAANEFGFKHTQELEGFDDSTIPHPLAEIADFFYGLDLTLTKNNRPITGIYALPFHGQTIPFIFNKFFIKDEEENNVLIYSHAIECVDQSMLSILNFLVKRDLFYHGKNAPATYLINGFYEGLKLDALQSQCFFYLLRKKSTSEISDILNIPQTIIQTTIELLFTQLNCINLSQAIESSITQEFLSIVPSGIINQLYGIKFTRVAPTHEKNQFTTRQQDCINLLLKGYTMKKIASELNLSPRTIETHLNILKNKLQCRNNRELHLKLGEMYTPNNPTYKNYY